MKKFASFILVTVVVALAALLFVQYREQSRIRAENESLRRELPDVGKLRTDNEALSNQLAEARNAQAKLAEQLQDLPKLRGEARALRGQTNDVARLRDGNRKLQGAAARVAKTPLMTFDFTDPGHFAGYATPEAAMQTTFWAMRGTDLKAMLDCQTPEERKGMEQMLRQDEATQKKMMEKVSRELAAIKSVDIMSQEAVSDSKILLHIFVHGPNREEVARFRRVNGDWKFDNFDGN